jgi:hypothetical protein
MVLQVRTLRSRRPRALVVAYDEVVPERGESRDAPDHNRSPPRSACRAGRGLPTARRSTPTKPSPKSATAGIFQDGNLPTRRWPPRIAHSCRNAVAAAAMASGAAAKVPGMLKNP